MSKITRVGIDLAKSVYHVHAVDRYGRMQLSRRFRRAQLSTWLAQLPACTVAMEACGGAHHWGRLCQRLGHTVRLLAPQFVKPYVKSNKHDRADAAAIVEASSRPSMRFVGVKDETQQVWQALHRVREQVKGQRSAVNNQLRGLLLEFGVEIGRGAAALKRALPELLEAEETRVPTALQAVLAERFAEWRRLDAKVHDYDAQLTRLARSDPRCRRLMGIPGIGPLTATAAVATVGDVRVFRRGRALAASLGLVPRQHSTGGKPRLLGISKRGDTYLRTLFIHGARAELRAATRSPDGPDARRAWLLELAERRGVNVATVALANKNARTAWALLYYGRDYQAAA